MPLANQEALRERPAVPGHGSNRRILVFEALVILAAGLLFLVHVVRLAQAGAFHRWWFPLVVLAAWLGADMLSGLIHWLADTWGNEELPFLGPRFVRPFRVHHVNPTAMLDCGFFDTNGDTALVSIPFLLAALALPLDAAAGCAAALFLVAMCLFGVPTNQIHYWAHMQHPPRLIAWLQKTRLILSREHHLRHHASPFSGNYCIATGHCNRMLDCIRFFRLLERLVTRVTGLAPRSDDREYWLRYQDAPPDQLPISRTPRST